MNIQWRTHVCRTTICRDALPSRGPRAQPNVAARRPASRESTRAGGGRRYGTEQTPTAPAAGNQGAHHRLREMAPTIEYFSSERGLVRGWRTRPGSSPSDLCFQVSVKSSAPRRCPGEQFRGSIGKRMRRTSDSSMSISGTSGAGNRYDRVCRQT